MFAIILISCLLLFAPLVMSLVRFPKARVESRVIYIVAMLFCLPLIIVWADIAGLPIGIGGTGDGWQEMFNLLVGFGVTVVANIIYWLGSRLGT
jgi:hypothetical protein